MLYLDAHLINVWH